MIYNASHAQTEVDVWCTNESIGLDHLVFLNEILCPAINRTGLLTSQWKLRPCRYCELADEFLKEHLGGKQH